MSKEYRDLSKRVSPAEVIEMEELPQEPKSISEVCVKCNWYEASYQYVGSTIEIIETKRMNGDSHSHIQKHSSRREVMIMTCVRCGYQWTDNPIDNQVDNSLLDIGVEDDTH